MAGFLPRCLILCLNMGSICNECLPERSSYLINLVMNCYNKMLALLALSGVFSGVGFAQDQEVEKKEDVREWVVKFGNLSEEKRKNYSEARIKARQFFSQKRTFESLEQIHKASAIFDEDPTIWNLKGSCYVEFRTFEKARKSFQKALELEPGNTGVLFNLAEMDYVTKNWQDCATKMLELVEKIDNSVDGELEGSALILHRLALFKIVLCHVKLEKKDEAMKLAQEKWDDFDDTPFTYYTKAAFDFADGNEEEGRLWINSAIRVFGGISNVASWQDTLIEAGLLESFFNESTDDA